MTDVPATIDTPSYKDDDLVYVDPDKRIVVGRVEFLPSGKAKSLEMPSIVIEDDEDDAPKKGKDEKRRRRVPRKRYYPWGTYRSMKRLYKLEGKQINDLSGKTFDEVLTKALAEPFWD